MNLNFYHYLTEIAEDGNLSTASEHLFITQSALTQALKKWSRPSAATLHLSKTLLHLTPLGQIVLEAAKEIDQARLQMTNSISLPDISSSGHLSVAVNIQTGSLLMGKIFARFHQHYPHLMVHIITASTNSAKKLLAQKAVDLIYYNEFQPPTPDRPAALCREKTPPGH